MADGKISISIEVDGKEVKVASKELDNLEASAGGVGKGIKAAESSMDGLADSSDKAGKSVKGAKDSIDGVGQGTVKASISLKDLATSLGLVALASAAFNTLKASLDSAISRFDTLNTFPKVLQSLGVSAEESEVAMNKLSDGIDGLPTTLDDIAGSAQQMYNSFKDMDKTTDTAIALNNALLASGADAEKAKRGTDQYIKALQTGQVTMDTWTTLQETMGIGLTKLAEEFGYVGNSAENDLYQALKSGAVTFDQFNAKLIELGTGTGELAALAKTNSLGIATSLGNLRNAAAKGIADIIKSFNKLSEDVTGKDIAANIDSLKKVVNASFKAIGKAIEATTPTITLFASAITGAIPVVKTLTPAIIGLMAAYGAYIVVSKASDAIKASNKILLAAEASQKALTIATNATTVAEARKTGAVTLSNVAMGLLSRQMTLATARTALYTTAVNALAVAKKFLMGPIGWITAGVGLLVTGFLAVGKAMGKASEEAGGTKAKFEEVSESVEELTDTMNNSSKAYEKTRESLAVTSKSHEDLIKNIDSLSAKENKSAADKALLKTSIDQLNGSMEGLNLTYSEQADSLNLTTEELKKKNEIFSAMAEQEADQQRLNDILAERNEIEMKIKDLIPIYEEAEEKYNSGTTAQKGQINVMNDAQAKMDELKEALGGLNAEEEKIAQEMIARQELVAQATEDGTLRQVIAFSDLNDKQKEVIESLKGQYDELWQNATNAFEKMDATSKQTLDSLQGNLEHNQEVMRNYGENVQSLLEWAGEHGYTDFIAWMEKMGPDAAGEVAVLAANLTDELEPGMHKFAETIENGVGIAMDGTKAKLGEGMDDVVEFTIEQLGALPTRMSEVVQGGEFESVGIAIGEGLGKGVEESSDIPVDAVGEMAEKTIQGAKDVLDVNSPSKEFVAIGESAPEGMVLGIENGANSVIEASKKLVTDFLNTFGDIGNAFQEIGASPIGAEDEETLQKAKRLIEWVKTRKGECVLS